MKGGEAHSSLAPVPSAELRVAIIAFRNALADAVRVVQVRKRLRDAVVKDTGPTEIEETQPAAESGDTDGMGAVDDGGGWQVVR